MFSSILFRSRINSFYTNNHRWIHKRKKIWSMTVTEFLRDSDELPVYQYTSKDTSKLHDKIYVWGFGHTGALGLVSFTRRDKSGICSTPRKVGAFFTSKVKDVACGHGFTVFVADVESVKTQLFGTGVNTDHQLGYHRIAEGELTVLTKPVAIYFPENEKSPKIKQVACGRAHTIILTTDNILHSIGNNSFGQCGVPILEKPPKLDYTLINEIHGVPGIVEKVVCGLDHTLFLLQSGEVYACGWSADGQTGLGYRNVSIPTKVCGDIDGEKIVDISSFSDGVLACNDKGDVFCWGNSEYAQFGLISDNYQVDIPKRLPLSVGKVKKVASGGSICGLVNDKGQVYVWGYGILGQGPNVQQSSKPLLLPEPLFGRNDVNPDVEVVSIYAGFSRWAAINNKGDLFCWGKNRLGCLGFKDEADRYFPMRVNLPVNVTKVSLGADHTAIIGRSVV